MRVRKAYGYALGAVACWSTMPAVGKTLLSGLPEMEVLAINSAFALALLVPLCAAKGRLRDMARLRARDWAQLAGLGFLGLFLYSALYFHGIARLSSQDACIVNYLWPAMIVLFSALFLKERLTARRVLGLAVSFVGLVVVAAKGDVRTLGMGDVEGVLSCAGAAVCYGAFCVLNKKAGYDPLLAMTTFFAVTCVCAAACTPFSGDWVMPTGEQWLGLVWLGAVVHGAAYLGWALAIEGGDTARVANLAYLTPFLAVVMSAFALGESVYAYSIVGLCLIMVGIGVQSLTRCGRKVEQ